MSSFNIYFSDLNEDAKKRLLDFCELSDPKEANWDLDIIPIAVFDYEKENEK